MLNSNVVGVKSIIQDIRFIFGWIFIISQTQVPIRRNEREGKVLSILFILDIFIVGGESQMIVRHQEFEQVEKSEGFWREWESGNFFLLGGNEASYGT